MECCFLTIYVQGRLVLQDGSIYDGMWRYGMRSGQGTVYFNNGDMFQGSWRDDVMHGKVCAILIVWFTPNDHHLYLENALLCMPQY